VALAAVTGRQGNAAAARAVLDAAETRLGDRVELRLARADDAVARGGAEARATLARLENDRGRLPKAAERALLSGLAASYARIRAAEARARRPWWPALAAAQAEAEDLAGNRRTALDHYRRAIDLGVTDPALIRRAVDLLYAVRRYDEAAGLLVALREQGPLT